MGALFYGALACPTVRHRACQGEASHDLWTAGAIAASWRWRSGPRDSMYYWTNDPTDDTLQAARFYVPAIGALSLLSLDGRPDSRAPMDGRSNFSHRYRDHVHAGHVVLPRHGRLPARLTPGDREARRCSDLGSDVVLAGDAGRRFDLVGPHRPSHPPG